MPAIRVVQDPLARRQAILILTGRYNVLGWISLGVLGVTGVLITLERISSWEVLFGTRYGTILIIKVLLFLGILALTAVHSFVLGPRMLAFPAESHAVAEPHLRRLQQWSGAVSALNLLLALLVLGTVVLLRGGGYL